MLRAAAAWLALLICAPPAWADWQFLDTWTDPIQDFETRAATISNADGYDLFLYRNPIGRVYVLITVPDGTPDLILEGAVATLTPDGFDTKSIEAQTERGRVVEYAISTGRLLRDRLWHGEGQSPAFGTFHDLLDAPNITATLALTTGDTTTTSWTMTGAGTPIARALGISLGGIPAGQEWEDSASQAMLAAMTACQFPKLDMACVQQVTDCADKISTDRDIAGFDACIAAD